MTEDNGEESSVTIAVTPDDGDKPEEKKVYSTRMKCTCRSAVRMRCPTSSSVMSFFSTISSSVYNNVYVMSSYASSNADWM